MPLTSLDIPSLIGGISEQPAEVRKSSQVSVAENVTLDPSRGLAKRTGSEVVTNTNLPSVGVADEVEWLAFNGGAGHNHALRVVYGAATGTIHSVALDGPNKGDITTVADDVTRSVAASYLHGTTRLSHVTVGTTIFLANNSTVVTQQENTDPTPPNEYILQIKNPPVSIDRKNFVPLAIESVSEDNHLCTTVQFSGYAPGASETDDGEGLNSEAPETAGLRFGEAFFGSANFSRSWQEAKAADSLDYALESSYTIDRGFNADYGTMKGAYNISQGLGVIQGPALAGSTDLGNNMPGTFDTVPAAATDTDYSATWSNWVWELLDDTLDVHDTDDIHGGTLYKGTYIPDSQMLSLYNIDERTWRIKQGDDTNVILFSRDAGPVIENLPYKCFDGFQTRVTTDPESESDYYFLQYVKDDNAWLERAKVGEDIAWDAATLPHTLSYDYATSAFTFAPYVWEDRKVGDVEKHRAPSFLGQTIQAMSFYQDRLVLASGYNVIFSEAQEPGNFWRQSMVTLLDNDRLDLEMNATENGSGIVTSLTITPQGVLAGSDRSQYLITSGLDPFTGKNVRVDILGSQQMSYYTNPVTSGDSTYFISETGGSSRLWEYMVLDGGRAVPVDVSGHCPDLMDGVVTSLTSDSTNSEIYCVTDTGRTFVYRHLTSGQERLQAAWSERITALSEQTQGLFTVGDSLYEASSYSVYEILPIDHVDPCGWATHLDLRQPVVLNAAQGDGTYLLNSPTQGLTQDEWIVVDIDTGREIYLVPGSSPLFGPLIEVDPATINGIWGAKIKMNVELSEVIMKDPRTERPLLGGRSQLKTLTLRHSDSGTFTVHKDVGGEVDSTTHNETNQTTTEAFGAQPPTSGTFITDIGGNATETKIRITSDDHYPTTFTSSRYEVLFYRRGR